MRSPARASMACSCGRSSISPSSGTRSLRLAAERSLYVVVIGGGAAGAEVAMALQHRFGERARVSLVTGGGPPLPSHPPVVQQRVHRALRRLNITEFDEACTEVTDSHVVLASGVRLACEAPIIAIGNGAPKWLPPAGWRSTRTASS